MKRGNNYIKEKITKCRKYSYWFCTYPIAAISIKSAIIRV